MFPVRSSSDLHHSNGRLPRMTSGNSYRRGMVAGVLLMAALLVALALLSVNSRSTPRAPADPSGVSDAKLRFTGLRSATPTGPGDPRADRARANARILGQNDEDFETYEVRRGTAVITAGIGAHAACLSIIESPGHGSQTCTDAATATDPATPLVSLDLVAESRWRVTALLPDDTTDVVLVDGAGERATLELRANLVTGLLGELPAKLEWRGADGRLESMTMNG